MTADAESQHNERKAQPIDAHVGKRIRMRRSMLGITQEKLAESVGLTFQQIQKYERGMNRVSASRLYQFSQVLEVPVQYFYQEFAEGGLKRPRAAGMSDNPQEGFAADQMLYSRETLDLVKIYYSVNDERKRKELLKIIRSMVENMSAT